MTQRSSPQKRQERLLGLIPFHSIGDYPCSADLLARMASEYQGREPAARRRQIERDLESLLDAGRIEVVDASQKPRHFRRLAVDPAKDPRVQEYLGKLAKAMLDQRLPSARQAQLWAVLDDDKHAPLLEDRYFRAINDTQRLLPADIKIEVLQAVLAALIQRQALRVLYEKQDGTRQKPLLHPQGLLQRGPILYLYALKDEETQPVKKFALHRMIDADVEPVRARDDPGFNLDQRIHDGEADYGHGETVRLRLRVSGYVTQLLRDCKLDENQLIEDLYPPINGFHAEVSAEVPSTGQLYRWLLGFGPLVEVIEPPHLRDLVRGAALAMSELYRQDAGTAGEG